MIQFEITLDRQVSGVKRAVRGRQPTSLLLFVFFVFAGLGKK